MYFFLFGLVSLEVQLAYLVDFAQFLKQFVSQYIFLHSKLVLHCFESLFSGIRIQLVIFIWSCTRSSR